MAAEYVPAGLSLLSVGTSILDQQSQAASVAAQQKLIADDALYSQEMSRQEVEQLDIALGAVLDQSAIQALKDEATLEAMTSATGLSGTITSDVVAEATIARREREMQATDEFEARARNELASMVARERELERQQTLLTDQLLTGEEAFLKTLGAGLSGMQTGLNYLSPESQNAFFGR